MLYTMMQVCKETGLTYQTLKFYCNEGLVPNVKRDKNNRRIFDERDVAWLGGLTCLKKCGMSIQEMKDYLALCLQGYQFCYGQLKSSLRHPCEQFFLKGPQHRTTAPGFCRNQNTLHQSAVLENGSIAFCDLHKALTRQLVQGFFF